MTIDPTLGATNIVGRPDAATPTDELGQEQFLELMLAQLQNQSPLDPMDSEQFLGQLAQFSTLEQMTGMNDRLDLLSELQAGVVDAQNVQLIGKSIVYSGSDVQLLEGSGEISFDLPGDPDTVRVMIKNEDGALVRTLELPGLRSGDHDITWNGRNDAGTLLPDGNYRFEVEALKDGEELAVETRSSGRVDGVSYKDGFAMLLIGSVRVNPGNVLDVNE